MSALLRRITTLILHKHSRNPNHNKLYPGCLILRSPEIIIKKKKTRQRLLTVRKVRAPRMRSNRLGHFTSEAKCPPRRCWLWRKTGARLRALVGRTVACTAVYTVSCRPSSSSPNLVFSRCRTVRVTATLWCGGVSAWQVDQFSPAVGFIGAHE